MSDTEQLFIVAAVWAAVSALIARFVPNWPGRVALFAILVGVPFWELPYGYLNFRDACREHARLVVLSRIDPQDSICIRDLTPQSLAVLRKIGFSRIEVLGGSDDPSRDSASGHVTAVGPGEQKSRYCVEFARDVSMPAHLMRAETRIVDARTNGLVAHQSVVDWKGLWWQREASPLFGSGGVCFEDPAKPFVAVRNGAS